MLGHPTVVRRAQYLMIAGLLSSFVGSEIIEGAATGLVTLGVLPVVWVPLYTTVTDVQDSFAASIARLVEKRDPGRVLVACESVDVVISLIALALILTLGKGHHVPVLIGYLLLASVLPLVVDLAEEFYLNDIGQVDAKLVLRANTMVSVGTGVGGLMLARPVGALISSATIAVILTVNIAFSLLAVLLRWRSTITFHPKHVVEGEDADNTPHGFLAKIKDLLLPQSPRHLISFGFLSPLFSFFVSLAPAMIATYVLLWLANQSDTPLLRLGTMLFVMGVIQALSPLLISWLMRNREGAAAAHLLTVFLCITVGAYLSVLASATLVPEGKGRFFLAITGLLVGGACVRGIRFAISTLRQSCLSQADFRAVVGWSYSLTSIGTIAGSWLGYTLKTENDPRFSLACATITIAGIVAWVGFKRIRLPAK